jgi:hypothetical protein
MANTKLSQGDVIHITATWCAGFGTVSTYRTGYPRAFFEHEQDTQIVMFDRDGYIELSQLNDGEYQIAPGPGRVR